jgi:glycosyltransferase involved in cell wall biosynthesis
MGTLGEMQGGWANPAAAGNDTVSARAIDLPRGISILVPVYNSEASLPALVDRLERVLPSFELPFEVLLVNDASTDDSWSAIVELVRLHGWIRGMRMMRNYGQHNALLAGLRLAHFDTAVTLDDDLQHPPEEISKLVAKLHQGFDVVYGAPERHAHSALRSLASIMTKIALQSAMGAESARHVSAFRAFKTELRQAFDAYQSPFVSLDVLLTWGTRRFTAVRVRHDVRLIGQSSYTVGKLVRHAANMMTGFSVLPLQLASIIGFALSLFGIAILVYVLVRYAIHGSTVAGFPFLASIISIFSGAQLFALGVLGEYLARMHFRLMDKPSYTVIETVTART